MKTLIQYIKESLHVYEGGSSIEGASPIRGDKAKPVADKIINVLKKKFDTKYATLGSVGKKGPEQESGDIDIAIELDWNKHKEVLDYCKQNLGNVIEGNIVPSLKVFNIGYEYELSKIVQVDFMFVDNVEFAEFAYHSPSFIKNESKYKGMYRSTLLMSVVACTPVDKPVQYDDNNELLDYYRYAFNQSTGMMLLHKSYAGKTKRLKTAKTIDKELVTKSPKEIVKICLGDKATIDDVNSFESLLSFICSSDYKYYSKKQLNDIKKHFMTNTEMKSKTSNALLNEIDALFDAFISK